MTEHDEINPGMVRRESFGSTELQVSGGMQDAAVAAAMQAQILARCTIAIKRPRHWQTVRTKIAFECKRPEFAAVAMYSIPRAGKKVEGLSIRFAEMALRVMTNLHAESNIIYDDPSKRMIQVDVSDLEANVTYSNQVVVEKTVERSVAKGNVISQRQNSQGKPVYVVRATDDEVQQKSAVLISKSLRAHVLRILPGDIQDEAKALIFGTLSCKPEDTNQWARTVKDMVDAYAGTFRVMPMDLEKHLGHPLDQLTPQELVDLRLLFGSLRTGEIHWSDVAAESGDEHEDPSGKPATKVGRVKELLAARKAAQTPKPAQETAADKPATANDDAPADSPADEYRKTADRITAQGQIEV